MQVGVIYYSILSNSHPFHNQMEAIVSTSPQMLAATKWGDYGVDFLYTDILITGIIYKLAFGVLQILVCNETLAKSLQVEQRTTLKFQDAKDLKRKYEK